MTEQNKTFEISFRVEMTWSQANFLITMMGKDHRLRQIQLKEVSK